MNCNVTLHPLREHEKETFILAIQAAFKKAVIEEWGSFEGEIISREAITGAFNETGAQSYTIRESGKTAGGMVVIIRPDCHNELLLFFVNADCHSKGIGQAAWSLMEQMYPETKVWETFTPYFEKRNIHFYVNKCGFHIVEFFNPKHPMPEELCTDDMQDGSIPGEEYFLRFEKQMK